jgi:hypothetical protein
MSEVQLDSLRSEGAWRLDPLRFRYLEALSRRLQGQPEPVRRLLQDKLQAALCDYAERVVQSKNAGCATPALQRVSHATIAPLAQLNEYIRGAAPAAAGAGAPGTGMEKRQEHDELASARRFRRAWSNARSQDRVRQASTRKPVNAGPLNSHVLVLESLAMMRNLSPDYLARFLVQVESLLWLEQESIKAPRQQAKAGGAAKGRKR